MSNCPLHLAISGPINISELYCVFEQDGYGIGKIRGTQLYTSRERCAQDVSKDDEIAAPMRLDLALDSIQDAYWAQQKEAEAKRTGRTIYLPPTYFKTDFYRKYLEEGHLKGLAVKE